MLDRLMQKVRKDKESGCWLWIGAKAGKGYGVIRVGSRTDGSRRCAPAHRVSYELHKGPIPNGLQIDHLCEVKNCINPDHLEPVTNKENHRRMMERGRHFQANQTHCKRGHEFTEENTYRFKTKTGFGRECKTCRLIKGRIYDKIKRTRP